MTKALQVLIAEDNATDAELLLRELRRADFSPQWERVHDEAAFVAALGREWELVISDFQMPQFDGLRALALVRSSGKEIPFILVSGTVGEDVAVEAMKQGAADYLLKDRLARLGPAVQRALDEAHGRRNRLRAEEALRESEERLKLALVATGMGVWVWHVRTNEVEWTPECYRVMGVTEFGGTLDDFTRSLHPEDRDRVIQAVTTAMKERRIYEAEFRIVRPDGEVRWLANRGHTTYDAAGQPVRITGTVRDITEQRRAAEELWESRESFRQVVETIHEVFWIFDVRQRRISYVSPSFEVVWGRSGASMCESYDFWESSVHPEDRARVLAAAEAGERGQRYDETYRIVRPDGTVRWVHDMAFPVRRADGSVYRIVGVVEDITERKALEDKFLRTQRMEAIGTLAGGIAHDLNNILAPIVMGSGMLARSLTDPHDLEILRLIQGSGARATDVVRQLLTFGRGIAGKRMSVQLRHLVKDMLAIARETFPRDIEVEDHVARDLRPVIGDPTQLHQVVLNLCVNARDAMPEGGRLVIEGTLVDLTPAEAEEHPPARPGWHVALAVADTGCGMPPAVIERIYDPFFTTKEPGKGTGLGLSTVLGIVRSHGGFITVKSEPGKGSTFTVFLPAADAEVAPTVEEGVGDAPPGHGECILVVDDEAMILQAARFLLERHGYRVVTAGNGQTGISAFMEHQESVALVLTDVMMPVMGGISLVRGVRAIATNVPILAISGLNDQAKHDELIASGATRVLLKPINPQELLGAIHHELAARSAPAGSGARNARSSASDG